jgi:hypothetical protein
MSKTDGFGALGLVRKRVVFAQAGFMDIRTTITAHDSAMGLTANITFIS